MIYPNVENIPQEKETINVFTGYEHTPTCPNSSFYDMKNISTEEYPIIETRRRRGIVKTFTKFQGMIDKDGVVWVDNGKLYIDNTEVQGVSLDDKTDKIMEKMGAYIVIFPDKVWYNTDSHETGNIDASAEITGSVSFTLCGADGTAITWHDASYYDSHTPQNGDYKMETVNGKTSLSVYSSNTGLWAVVATTYMKIAATNIGKDFVEGDGVKVIVDLTNITWDYAKNVFPNDEGSNKRSNTFTIKTRDDDYIIVPALLDENKTISTTINVDRKAPDMSFIVECQNRLWGCKPDGHEIYCCKLGDVKNWNVFQGISTDSWAATIGSDGVFTGAINYMGYPLFFKEDAIIRVSPSSIGAHSTKETKCRGVEAGSEKSLVQLNEVLLYKSLDAVCLYDGSFPTEVSKQLGQEKYSQAIGGSNNNRYYISMKQGDVRTLFVYDIKTGLWAKEDNVNIVQFCRHADELFFVANSSLYTVFGSHPFNSSNSEPPLGFTLESGKINYELASKKYASRLITKNRVQNMNIRLTLGEEAYVSLYIKYDDKGWEHQWNVSGKETKTVLIPIRPHRCDHFSYMLQGRGNVKIYSITKTIVRGNDV